MKLVYEGTNREVKPGDAARTFRGEPVTVRGVFPPRHDGSTGRVLVEFDNGVDSLFFPSVIDAHWVKED